MTTPTCNIGLTLASLLLLSACAAKLPAPQITLIQRCPLIALCPQPIATTPPPETNGDLLQLLVHTEAALQFCAAQVAMMTDCQTAPLNDVESYE